MLTAGVIFFNMLRGVHQMSEEIKEIDTVAGIRLRYVGERFEGARLPLDVLADLPAFRDLLVAFAKQQWRTVNTDRQRVPKGFDQSLSFDLTAIEEGSAIPQLQWDRSAAQRFLPGFTGELQGIVEESYFDIVTLVDNAARGIFPKVLASEHVRALNKFGSGLRRNERIEFLDKNGADGNVVYLDFSRRKELITKVRETYVARFEGTGTLVGLHATSDAQAWIDVETPVHGLIKILLDSERVTGEFDGNLNSPVQFDLNVELDNADKFRSVVDVHAVALIDERIAADLERCRERLSEILRFEAGWDDGVGRAVDGAAINAAKLFLSTRPLLCGLYKIFPTTAGGVLFEFEVNGWDLSLEFMNDGAVEMFGFQLTGDSELDPVRFDVVNVDLIAEFDKYVGRDGR